ncbi:hypothetical protein EVAR_84799_1 [Eumeta japonica]|uniref:Uncharacterized protein n=1 Tax=Eumeta variegata TaxID=151549 RepID=A0A4C1U8B5_EUMVA|nr:hypothetical protein EVAR_84799_1 [Eumeta japonica]
MIQWSMLQRCTLAYSGRGARAVGRVRERSAFLVYRRRRAGARSLRKEQWPAGSVTVDARRILALCIYLFIASSQFYTMTLWNCKCRPVSFPSAAALCINTHLHIFDRPAPCSDSE